jgi:septal ring factor EnvC (AmiA/AmiB activator)
MEGLQMGFIGQEAETVVPEVVSVNNDHYSMQYAPITALLVEAVREQQKQISNQNEQIKSYKSENDNLKSQLQSIQEKVDKIEILMAESRGN